MKKVAFYLDNRHIALADCRDILKGNPGIGGTEYMFIVIAYLLSIRDNGLEVNTYTRSEGIFPDGYKYEVVESFENAVGNAVKSGFDYFVFKHDASVIESGILDAINPRIKLIVWDHVFVCYWELDYYANNPNIYKVVNVGQEMNDLYIDHKIYTKFVPIYNCLNLDGARELVYKNPFERRKNVVVYVGALLPYKGFHLLAKAWPEIVKKVPDAELYVIGSGKLYDSNSKLGRFGIAEESYEESFMPFLTKAGKILPNVHFMGKMGYDKNEILLQAKVGVPNPSGITETFCISAVEMQAMGELVTTINYPGFLDTIRNGKIYRRREDLAKNVIELLGRGHNDNYEETMSFFDKNFSYQAVVSKWERLLRDGMSERRRIENKWYRLKWLKEIKWRLSGIFPIVYKLPPIERLLLKWERLCKGCITYIDSDKSILY